MSLPMSAGRRLSFLAVAGLYMPIVALAAPSPTPTPPPTTIEFVAPSVAAAGIPHETTGAWPLTLRITADNKQLLGVGWSRRNPTIPTLLGFTRYALGGFPEGLSIEERQRYFLVFAEPDSCHSWVTEPDPNGCPSPPYPVNETHVEFVPSITSHALSFDEAVATG